MMNISDDLSDNDNACYVEVTKTPGLADSSFRHLWLVKTIRNPVFVSFDWSRQFAALFSSLLIGRNNSQPCFRLFWLVEKIRNPVFVSFAWSRQFAALSSRQWDRAVCYCWQGEPLSQASPAKRRAGETTRLCTDRTVSSTLIGQSGRQTNL